MVDPIDKAVMKFQSHPSICKIKENTTSSVKFDFREVTIEDVAVQIKNLVRIRLLRSIPYPLEFLRKILMFSAQSFKFCTTMVYPKVSFLKN